MLGLTWHSFSSPAFYECPHAWPLLAKLLAVIVTLTPECHRHDTVNTTFILLAVYSDDCFFLQSFPSGLLGQGLTCHFVVVVALSDCFEGFSSSHTGVIGIPQACSLPSISSHALHSSQGM